MNALTFIIDGERLTPVREYLVLADVPVPRGAVPVRGFHPNYLVVYATFVYCLHVRRLAEDWRELVHVRHRDVDWYPEDKGTISLGILRKIDLINFYRAKECSNK